MTTNYYLGRFGEEHFLFEDKTANATPFKGDIIYFDNEFYKVMYRIIDYDTNDIDVFVREVIEEDF